MTIKKVSEDVYYNLVGSDFPFWVIIVLVVLVGICGIGCTCYAKSIQPKAKENQGGQELAEVSQSVIDSSHKQLTSPM